MNQPIVLTPEGLTIIVATLISLIALLVPGVNTRFAALPKDTKQAIMAWLTIGSGVVIYFLACTPAMGFTLVACPAGGLWEFALTVILAAAANQSVYRLIREPESVREAKALRLPSE